jgi:tetratricopeptide (TPR) repeat protein
VNNLERDLTLDKIKLIYEYNESSPLFARVAAYEIKDGNIFDAINILETGISIHPSYPTAYLVLALANAYAGKEEDAKNSAATGSELLGSPETLDYYKNKISEIIFERNTLSETTRPAFIVDDETEKPEDDFENMEDKLDLLAERLSKAKIIPKEIGEPTEEITIPEVKVKKIVTDTMAEIFISQKNFKEALAIYTELLRQRPEKAGIYLQKISDLNSLMEK